MEKFKIAVVGTGKDNGGDSLFRSVLEDPAMQELCSPSVLQEDKAFRKLEHREADALVLYTKTEPTKHLAGAIDIVVTDKTHFMPLGKEPAAEDISKFCNILERDFDQQLPRIAIVWETEMQNPDLASQVTTELGINTYGPYTIKQITAQDAAHHFDGIVTDEASVQRLIAELSLGTAARFYAGMESVVTAVIAPAQQQEEGEGLADVSWLTRPFFVATDIVRNRAFYDEARQNPLPKLFRDKRDERKKDDAARKNSNDDNTEQAS